MRFVHAYSIDGTTGDNVMKVVKALKKLKKSHRVGVELDPEPKPQRPRIKSFQRPVSNSSQKEPKVISLEDISSIEDLVLDSNESESESESDSDILSDSEGSGSDIVVCIRIETN